MSYLFSAIVGIVQGLAEFLPISSSGHIILAEKLLSQLGYEGSANPLAFSVMLHMGTLLAVAAVFWKDWIDMILHPIKNRTLLLLFIASLPALLIFVAFGDFIDTLFEGWFLGIAFLITAAFLVFIEMYGRWYASRSKKTEVNMPAAITMGVFQGIALLPGVSRSGSTLLGGVFSGLTRHSAAKFSFMMSAPAILGGFLSEGKKALEQDALPAMFSPESFIGFIFAAIFGFLAIRYMLRLIERISFYKFALYVGIVGIVVIILQLTNIPGFPPIALPQAAPIG
ncbi:MAG: undecaprenyl-diphosphate phosphatase [Clostridiales bacterium]|nr:undecaprenyl-diphosphate phosphatase [Clostridiales bacterium]